MPTFKERVDIRLDMITWATAIELEIKVEAIYDREKLKPSESGVLMNEDDYSTYVTHAVYDWCDRRGHGVPLEWQYSDTPNPDFS